MGAQDKANPAGEFKARHLIRWFNRGADGQIPWGAPGAFRACVVVASKHMRPEQAKGFCNLRNKDATGHYAGQNGNLRKALTLPVSGASGPIGDPHAEVAAGGSSGPDSAKLGEVVTLWAGTPASGDYATLEVDRTGDRFQVRKAHAGDDPAQMVYVVALADRTMRLLPSDAVSKLPAILPVPVGKAAAGPQSAGAEVGAIVGDRAVGDVALEWAVTKQRGDGVAVLAPTPVVPLAHPRTQAPGRVTSWVVLNDGTGEGDYRDVPTVAKAVVPAAYVTAAGEVVELPPLRFEVRPGPELVVFDGADRVTVTKALVAVPSSARGRIRTERVSTPDGDGVGVEVGGHRLVWSPGQAGPAKVTSSGALVAGAGDVGSVLVPEELPGGGRVRQWIGKARRRSRPVAVEKHGEPGQAGYQLLHPGGKGINVVSGRGRLNVESPYNATFVADVKRMGGKWKPDRKVWSVPGDQAAELEAALERAYGGSLDGAVSEADLPDKVTADIVGGRLRVMGPYSEEWRVAARRLGGKWDGAAKAWTFHPDDRATVIAAARAAYSVPPPAATPARGSWSEHKPSAAPKKASPRQIDYALSLMDRGSWEDSDMGQGFWQPSRRDLESMTAAEVSAIIDDMRDQFY